MYSKKLYYFNVSIKKSYKASGCNLEVLFITHIFGFKLCAYKSFESIAIN